MNILTLIIIAISLSVDAFSLSLAYGLMKISNVKIFLISFLVGVFHFIMPLLGKFLGNYILNFIILDIKFIIILIFLIIIIEMIKSLKEEKEEFNLSIINAFFFAFAVSLDSFSVGIGISYFTNSPIIASVIFSILSFSFTFLGFKLGKIINHKIGKYSKILGILLLFSLTVYILCK